MIETLHLACGYDEDINVQSRKQPITTEVIRSVLNKDLTKLVIGAE